jgi:hypothetical protein
VYALKSFWMSSLGSLPAAFLIILRITSLPTLPLTADRPVLLNSIHRIMYLMQYKPGYGLDSRGVEVRGPVRSRFFTFLYRPDRLWGPPSLLHIWYRGLFPGRGG